MARDLLKDSTIQKKIKESKAGRLNDGSGLYLKIMATGACYWRFDYTLDDTRKTLSFGTYPRVTLATARDRAEKARKKVTLGTDPSQARQQEKADRKRAQAEQLLIDAGIPLPGSFEFIARQWLDSIEHTLKPQTFIKKLRRFENYAFPALGRCPIDDIKPLQVKAVITPMVERDELETAHRHCAEISALFDHANAHELTENNPARIVAKQIPPQKVSNHAALTNPADVAILLRAIDAYHGSDIVRAALKISPLIFQRPGEIRQMQWADLDLDAQEWRYTVTKTDTAHIVPLARQAVEIITSLRQETGNGRYVFPSMRRDGRPMSDGTILTALKTLGYSSDQMTAHGFRTLASTLLNEMGWTPDAIERQLCHQPRDKIRATYNRAQYLDERRRMMQSWADYLDQLKAG